MRFCTYCGEELRGGAKFCDKCGKPLWSQSDKNSNENKKQESRSSVPSSCPRCGTPLNSFMLNCPACGCEVRKPKEVSSVRELALKLEEIESQRANPPSFPKSKKDGSSLKQSIVNMYFGSKEEDEYDKELDKYEMLMDQIDDKKIDVIRNFPIPNTTEDLHDFFSMAKSNINFDSDSDKQIELSKAWKAKLDQAYEKAKMLLTNDPRFVEMQQEYNSTCKEVNIAKKAIADSEKADARFAIIFSVIFFGAMIIFFVWMMNDTKKEEKLELERMDAIVEEIEDALEDKDYKLALMHAKTLEYTLNDEDLKKEWQIKQEYYIDKIYEEAEKNDIILEQPPDETADNETSGNESSKTIGDEIQGFFDELAQDLDDAFNESSE